MRNTGYVHLVAPAGLHPVRLALCIGGIVFDDRTLSPTDVAEGQYAELHVNGTSFTHFDAMFRLAGRLSGLYPVSSPVMALHVDEILHVLNEARAKTNNSSELETTIILRYASSIEARLQRLGGIPAFKVLNDNVFLHEIALYCWVKSIRKTELDVEVDKHKCIFAAASKVENHRRVKHLSTQDSKMYPKLKLTYFPFPGRAEPIRLALFISGIPFEDERIDVEELNKRRSTLPFNQLPVLQVDGEVVSQALGILRYVGTLGGLYSPSNSKEVFRIDELFSVIDEFYSSYTWNASYFETDSVEQMRLRTILAKETLPKTLNFLEQRTSKWNERYSVCARLTVADLAIYSLLWTFQSGRILGVPVSVVAPYKMLLGIYEAVANHPKAREWGFMKH
ncbi:hypothetical protein F441_16351 [Phytophthora nicotianae CJ01A1]|uniref:GST N-terminal domain-containing protein n=4 Tax=Phytophthora nicotianae TaxID=4792 RepID=W2YKK2_PHYNI|nr:hypothetical protein L916_15957 [Phytophthora nicotianae]ETO66250.1 hypothetical protein F444_16511 [Phytophthora nicotianae P1976]ETP07349.1 hypothetical protein F441_16351 [Phytophthora nicotianae CJ01A1]ETP35446.1 hypothetical protein F442_16376 [Phytophthora nicotianae P10297]